MDLSLLLQIDHQLELQKRMLDFERRKILGITELPCKNFYLESRRLDFLHYLILDTDSYFEFVLILNKNLKYKLLSYVFYSLRLFLVSIHKIKIRFTTNYIEFHNFNSILFRNKRS